MNSRPQHYLNRRRVILAHVCEYLVTHLQGPEPDYLKLVIGTRIMERALFDENHSPFLEDRNEMIIKKSLASISESGPIITPFLRVRPISLTTSQEITSDFFGGLQTATGPHLPDWNDGIASPKRQNKDSFISPRQQRYEDAALATCKDLFSDKVILLKKTREIIKNLLLGSVTLGKKLRRKNAAEPAAYRDTCNQLQIVVSFVQEWYCPVLVSTL